MSRVVAGPLYITHRTLCKFLQVRHTVLCCIGSVRGHQVLPPLLASANNNTKIMGVTSGRILLSSQGCQNHAHAMAAAAAAAAAAVTEVSERPQLLRSQRGYW